MKLLFLISSCSGRLQDIYNVVKDSEVFEDILLLADGDEDDDTIIYHKDKRIIRVPVSDEYDKRVEQIVHAYHFIHDSEEHKDYTHIVQLQDKDSRIQHLKDFRDLLMKQPEFEDEKEYYLGERILTKINPTFHLKVVKPESPWHGKPYIGETTIYADGGISFLVLRRKALDHIYAYTHPLNKEFISRTYIYGDLMVAIILRKYDIHPKRIKNNLRDVDMKRLLKEKIQEDTEETNKQKEINKKKSEDAEKEYEEKQRLQNEARKNQSAVKGK